MAGRPVPRSASFAFDIATRSLDEQLSRVEAFDTKAVGLLAADGLLIGLVPRPLEGGSYSVESIGGVVDRLLGHERAVRQAAEHLEPLLARRDDMPEDPEPAQIPDPIPGGSELITRGE